MPDLFGVMGHPVSHSKSPLIHAEFARQTGQDMEYHAIHVLPGEFTTAIKDFQDRQGKGLGFDFCKALIEEGLSRFGKRNITLKVNLDNQRAIRLYERMGFRPATGELGRNVSGDAMILILPADDLDRFLNA